MKTKTNKVPLFVGIVIVAISEIASFLLGQTDLTNASLLERYDHALAGQFWAVMGLLGWTICFIWLIVYWVKKKRHPSACESCGAKPKSKADVFCRACGAKLAKKSSIEEAIPPSRRLM